MEGAKFGEIAKNVIGKINFGKLMTCLIKHILKQFKDTSAPNLSIYAHMFVHTCKLRRIAFVIFSSIYD